jgi:hypothetical protein
MRCGFISRTDRPRCYGESLVSKSRLERDEIGMIIIALDIAAWA